MPKNILAITIILFFSSILHADELKFKKIVNLSKPWGSSFINENELIITEKKGKIKIININSGEIFEVIHNLNFRDHGQGGLLDIIYKEVTWMRREYQRENNKGLSTEQRKVNKCLEKKELQKEFLL